MSRPLRPIDPERLRRLRDLVKASQPPAGEGLPWDKLAELATECGSIGNVTVDYRAVPDLGFPMVVLHAKDSPKDDLDLTPREVEVAKLIADGLSNKEIAQRLGITLLTAKDHVHRILEKTGLPNRAAVAVAIRA
jgi:DNA-binding CsgD family transcriptional regulator